MIVVGSKPFGGWRSHQSNRFDDKKHSEKSAFLIKLCRYLLAISPRRIYFPMQHTEQPECERVVL